MGKKDLTRFIERVKRKNAIGVIFNCPKKDLALIQNRLLDSKKSIVIDGHNAYTSEMFINRLSTSLKKLNNIKLRRVTFDQVPALLDGKLIVLTNADILKISWSRILENSFKYKIPMLLLMNNGVGIKNLRKFPAYNRVLTIEQDFQLM